MTNPTNEFVSVTFDPDRRVWVVTSTDQNVEPETFDNVADAEQFAADMRRAGTFG